MLFIVPTLRDYRLWPSCNGVFSYQVFPALGVRHKPKGRTPAGRTSSMYTYIHTYISKYVRVSQQMNKCVCIYIYTHACRCMYLWVYISMCSWTYSAACFSALCPCLSAAGTAPGRGGALPFHMRVSTFAEYACAYLSKIDFMISWYGLPGLLIQNPYKPIITPLYTGGP